MGWTPCRSGEPLHLKKLGWSVVDLERRVVDPEALVEELFELEADCMTVVPRMHQYVG